MNKNELIAAVAEKAGLTKKDADAMLKAFVDTIEEELVKGEHVIVFKKKRRKGYRRLNGHRQQFTQVVIKEVVA